MFYVSLLSGYIRPTSGSFVFATEDGCWSFETCFANQFKNVYFYLKFIARVIIPEREKELDKINSLKDQLTELQEKLGDAANTQLTAERVAIDKLLTTEQSKQSYIPSPRNVELETEIKKEDSLTTTPDATKGKIFFFCENSISLIARKTPYYCNCCF